MRNLLLTFLILTAFVNAYPQSGVLKVRQFGYVCHQQTADDILGMDGISDEVIFFNYSFVSTGNNTLAPARGLGGNFIYGEKQNSMKDWNIRVKTGTASINGGIKTGDREYFSSASYVIDQVIGPDYVVCIAPSIWEYDNTTEYNRPSIEFINKTKATLGSIFFQQQVRSQLAGFNYNGIDNYNFLIPGRYIDLDNQYANVFKPFPGLQHTRPIGMMPNNEFSSQVMVLNSRLAALLANKDFGYGQGVVPILYNDVTLGNTVNHGVYSILLKVEFTADATRPAAAPPPPPPPTQPTTAQLPVTNTKDFGIIKTTTTAQATVAGTWVGTWGNGNDNSPNFYSFRLNTDGTMQLIDAKGNITASGSYIFSKSQLTGSYTYTNADTYSFAATIDVSNIMYGTWGQGSNSTNGGKWTMRKK